MKRCTVMILALALIFCLFAGCGNNSSASNAPVTDAPQSSGSGTSGTPETPDVPEEPVKADGSLPLVDEPVTLTMFAGVWDGIYSYMDAYQNNSVFKELEKRTNVHIEMTEAISADAAQKFSILIGAGDYTDITNSGNQLYPGGGSKGIADEVFVDLSQYFEDYAPNYYKIISADQKLYSSVHTLDGYASSFYALIDRPSTETMGPLVRQDWLDEQGLPTPVTYDDWDKTLEVFKTEYDPKIPLDVHGAEAGTCNFNWICGGFGVDTSSGFFAGLWDNFIVRDGVVKYSYLEDGAREYYELMRKWYEKGYLYTDFYVSRSDDERAEDHANDNAGIMVFDYGVQTQVTTMGTANNPNFKLAALTDPVKNAGDKVHTGTTRSYLINPGATYEITTGCDDLELAMRWIDYLYTQDGATLVSYGVEGELYNIGDDGKIHYTEIITGGELSRPVAFMVYAGKLMGGGYTFFDREFVDIDEASQNSYNTWANCRDDEWKVPSYMQWDSEDLASYTNLMGDINTLVTEYSLAFITGDRDLSQYDELISRLESMNIQEAIRLVQKNYDANFKK